MGGRDIRGGVNLMASNPDVKGKKKRGNYGESL